MNTILLVEDDPEARQALALILQMEGFTVATAPDGLAGLERIDEQMPDLILCDVTMPRLDGHGLLAAIRSKPATAGIPLIFLTAHSDHADLRQGMNLGADDYLTKPAKRDDVLAAIHARLARRNAQEQATLARIEVRPDFRSTEPLRRALGLTAREAEVLLWVAQGKSNPEIAGILGVAEQTVKLHLNHVFEKLSVENRYAATVQALEILSTARI